MCEVRVTGVVRTGGDISVAGTVQDCLPDSVEPGEPLEVNLVCGGTEVQLNSIDRLPGDDSHWYASFVKDSRCVCGRAVQAKAQCTTAQDCEDLFEPPNGLDCEECPPVGVVGDGLGDDVNIVKYDVECTGDGNVSISWAYSFTNVRPTPVKVKVVPSVPVLSSSGLERTFGPAGSQNDSATSVVVQVTVQPYQSVSFVYEFVDESGDPIGCPPQLLPDPGLHSCCDSTPQPSVSVERCTATFSGSELPDDCKVQWTVSRKDGTEIADFVTTSFDKEYDFPESGEYLVTVKLEGCSDGCFRARSFEVVVAEDCDTNDGGEDDEPWPDWACSSLLIVAALGIAAMLVAIVVLVCFDGGTASWIILGVGAAVFLASILAWYHFCAKRDTAKYCEILLDLIKTVYAIQAALAAGAAIGVGLLLLGIVWQPAGTIGACVLSSSVLSEAPFAIVQLTLINMAQKLNCEPIPEFDWWL